MVKVSILLKIGATASFILGAAFMLAAAMIGLEAGASAANVSNAWVNFWVSVTFFILFGSALVLIEEGKS